MGPTDRKWDCWIHAWCNVRWFVVQVRLRGIIGADGYLMDFRVVKVGVRDNILLLTAAVG
jgi:hypothetical protein